MQFYNLEVPIRDVFGRVCVEPMPAFEKLSDDDLRDRASMMGVAIAQDADRAVIITDLQQKHLKDAIFYAWSVVANAVVAPSQDVSSAEQIKRFSLAQRIVASPARVGIEHGEAEIIKAAVAKLRSPTFMARISEIIDGPPLAQA